MEFMGMFDNLAPFVQLTVVIGTFATIFLVACNRTAAINLITFLRDLYGIHRYKDQRDQQHSHYGYGQQGAKVGNGGQNKVAMSMMEELSLPFEAKHDTTLMAGREKDVAGQQIKAEVE
jgi:hypothetical protein